MSISEPAPNPNLPPAFPIPPSPPTLLSALRSLYLHISRNPTDKGTVSPRILIDKIKELNELFRGSMHQDAHEFLNFLLNRIMEEMEDDRRRLGSAPNGVAPSGDDRKLPALAMFIPRIYVRRLTSPSQQCPTR